MCPTMFRRKPLPGEEFQSHVYPDKFCKEQRSQDWVGWMAKVRKKGERWGKEDFEPGRLITEFWEEESKECPMQRGQWATELFRVSADLKATSRGIMGAAVGERKHVGHLQIQGETCERQTWGQEKIFFNVAETCVYLNVEWMDGCNSSFFWCQISWHFYYFMKIPLRIFRLTKYMKNIVCICSLKVSQIY